jgi:hypothetical protein
MHISTFLNINRELLEIADTEATVADNQLE